MVTFARDADSSFWDGFARDYWEQRPVAMRFEPGPAPLSVPDVFQALTNMPHLGPSDRFWLARSANPQRRADFAMVDLELMGPNAKDRDMDGFFARMATVQFGINVHALGLGRRPFAVLAGEFADRLSHVPGAPQPHSWRADTFVGNYAATPFGIHRDAASVFSFVLQGQRTYCFWPMEAIEPTSPDLHLPDREVLERHLGTAERFTAGPGDLIYWPSNRWHVILSDGQPFVAAQVSAYFDPEDVGQAG